MKYVLYYGNFPYEIDQCYQDILEYEYQRTFNEGYTPYYGLCTPEQKDFIKDFDFKWLHNDIHEYDYYTTLNYDFLNWVKEKYEEAAEEAQYAELQAASAEWTEEDDPDDWWGCLSEDEKERILRENI